MSSEDYCKQINGDNYVVELSYEKDLEKKIEEAKNKPLILVGPRFSGKTTAIKIAISKGVINEDPNIRTEISKDKIDEKEKEELKKLITGDGFRIIEATEYQIKYVLSDEIYEASDEKSIISKLKDFLKKISKGKRVELKLPEGVILVEANITEGEAEKIFECYVEEYLKKTENKTKTINESDLTNEKDHFIEMAYLGKKGKGIFIPQYLKRLIEEYADKKEKELRLMKEKEKETEEVLLGFFGISLIDLVGYSSNIQNFLEYLLPYLHGTIQQGLNLLLGPAGVVIAGLTLLFAFHGNDVSGGLDNYVEAYRLWNEMPQEKREALCSVLEEKFNLPPGSSCQFLSYWLSKDEIEMREKLKKILNEEFLKKLEEIVNGNEDLKRAVEELQREIERLKSEIRKVKEELEKIREEFYSSGTIRVKSERELTEIFKSRYGVAIDEKTLVGIGESEEDKKIINKALEIISKTSNKLVLIVGEPGAGKSTLLYIIGRELLNQGKKVYLIKDFGKFSPSDFLKLGENAYAIYDVALEAEAEEVKKELVKLSRGYRSVRLIIAIRSSFLKDFKNLDSVYKYEMNLGKEMQSVLLEIARRNLNSVENLPKEQVDQLTLKLVEKSNNLPLYVSEAVKKITHEKGNLDEILESLPKGIRALVLKIIDSELNRSDLLLMLYYLVSHYPNFPKELVLSAEILFNIPGPIYMNELHGEGALTLHSWYNDITNWIFKGGLNEQDFKDAEVDETRFKEKVEKIQMYPYLINNIITENYINAIKKTLDKKEEVLKPLKEGFEDFTDSYFNGDAVSLINLADLTMLFLIFHSVVTKLKKKDLGKGFIITKERIDPRKLNEESYLHYAKLIGFLFHIYLKSLEEEEIVERSEKGIKVKRPFYVLAILYISRLLNDELAKKIDEDFLEGKGSSLTSKYLEYIAKYYPYSEDRPIRYYISAIVTLLEKIEDFNPQSEFEKGLLLLCKGKFEEAIQEFNKAISKDKSKSEYYFYKGKALGLLKRYDDAINEFEEAIKLDQNNPHYHIDKGIMLSISKRYNEAIEEFNKALDVGNKEVYGRIHYYKGITLSDMNKLNEAIGEYRTAIETAIEHETENPDYHIKMGIALHKLGEFYKRRKKESEKATDALDKAIKAFDDAIKLDPINPQAHYNKGLVLLEKEEYEKATDEFNMAIKLKPHDPRYHYEKAVALRQLARYDEALKELDEAIKLDPNNPKYHFEKSIVLNQKAYFIISNTAKTMKGKELDRSVLKEVEKYYEKSLQEIDKVLKDDPINDRYLFTKGIALKGLGRFEEAIKFVEEALNKVPRNPYYLIVYATLKADLNSPEEGINKVREAVKAGDAKTDGLRNKLCKTMEDELNRNPVEKEKEVLSKIKSEVCANEKIDKN